MSIAVGPSGNSSRYYSMPDSPAFTLPDSNWSRLHVIYSDTTAPSGEDIVSTATYGAAQSYNLYLFDAGYGCKIHTLTDLAIDMAADTWDIVLVRRLGTSMTIKKIVVGSNIVTTGNTVAITAGYNAANEITFGRRSDVGNYWNGRISHVINIPGYAISDEELIQISTGSPMDTQAWWNHRSFHFHAKNSNSSFLVDLVGKHALKRNGTGYEVGLAELDPQPLRIFSEGEIISFPKGIISATEVIAGISRNLTLLGVGS